MQNNLRALPELSSGSIRWSGFFLKVILVTSDLTHKSQNVRIMDHGNQLLNPCTVGYIKNKEKGK